MSVLPRPRVALAFGLGMLIEALLELAVEALLGKGFGEG